MIDGDLSPEQIAVVTAHVDIEAPPPPDEPTAHLLFGTNQAQPAAIAALTRTSWPKIPDGRRRVVRESQEVRRRVADGSYRPAEKVEGSWR
ncbi:MAG TPA: hypothetical protein VEM58_08155 [Streptosporangiaceae bacterium]|nr:hypothetical protein [Streptosporangiaceae bacterium]